MTNPDVNQIKAWMREFSRLYFQSGHPDLSPNDILLIKRSMNRLAQCILASLPRIPEQAILIPSLNETYAVSIDPDWYEFSPDQYFEAFTVTPCISLQAARRPLELVG